MVCVFVFKFFIRGLKMCGGGRAGEAAQWVKCLMCKGEDLCSDLQRSHKRLGVVVSVANCRP